LNIEHYISSGIIEQYVLGLCDADEAAEIEQLRKQHPAMHDAIISFELAFENQMLSQATVKPNASTDVKVTQQFESLTASQNTSTLEQEIITAPVKKLNYFKWIAAASVCLLAASAYYNYTLNTKSKEQAAALIALAKTNANTLPASDYTILQNPRITPVGMYGQGAHSICRCTMFWDKASGKAYIMIHHLMPALDGKNYQLWATVNGKQIKVGIVNDKIRGRFVEVSGMPEDANEFIVSLENIGEVAQPTDIWLAGKI
jgi:anti-sigma-K factor RskA